MMLRSTVHILVLIGFALSCVDAHAMRSRGTGRRTQTRLERRRPTLKWQSKEQRAAQFSALVRTRKSVLPAAPAPSSEPPPPESTMHDVSTELNDLLGQIRHLRDITATDEHLREHMLANPQLHDSVSDPQQFALYKQTQLAMLKGLENRYKRLASLGKEIRARTPGELVLDEAGSFLEV